MILIFILACSSIAILVSIWKYRKWCQKASGLPGPRGLPVLGNALDLSSQKDIIRKLMEFKREYGKVFKIQVGPQLNIFVSDQKLIHHFLSNTKNDQKGQFYKFLKNWLENGILLAEGETWKKQKKFLNPAFHVKVLEGFLSAFAEGGDRLVQLFQDDVGKESVDIWDKLNQSTFDIFAETIMGLPAQSKLEEAEQYLEATGIMFELLISNTFSMKAHLPFVHKLTENYRKENKALEVLHGVTKSIIERKRRKFDDENRQETASSSQGENPQGFHNESFPLKRLSLLDLLLEAETGGRSLTDREIREQINTFMTAGHDTTTTAIYFTLYHLAGHPEIKKKVTDELKALPDLDYTSLQDLQKLKYLEMVIKETMRIHSVVPFIGRIVSEDENIDGYSFPKGATIMAFLYALHRDEDYFPNPEVFDPERFSAEVSPKAFCPFSVGFRPCIGQKFAMLLLKSVLAKFLNNFDVLPAVPHHRPQITVAAVVKSSNGLRFQLRNAIRDL